LDKYVGDVAVVGDYVYVTGCFSGLNILKLGPANPQSIGSVNASSRVSVVKGGRAAALGHYAYLADPDVGLQVIDIHDLTRPLVVGSNTNSLRWLCDVAVSGHYAYVAADNTGLEVIDVSDPVHPRRVGGLGSLGTAGRVAVSGSFAYVAGYGVGLSLVDISAPANPRRVGSYESDQAFAVAVSGNFAYLTEIWPGRLQVIDITNPATPHQIGEYQSLGHLGDITVSDHYAFLMEEAKYEGTNRFGGGLVIVDLTDPSHPAEIGRYGSSLWMNSVAVAGSYAYVVGGGGLHVIDISNPAHPRRVGGSSVLPDGGWSSVLVEEGCLYSAGNGKLTIFDLFRPFRLEPLPKPEPGAFRLRVDGPRGVSAWVQRSTNLTNWEDWQQITFGDAAVEVSDPEAVIAPHRIYRGVIR
jgi:hypothetical protein